MRCSLYLQYFNKDIPRSKGRKLSKKTLARFSEEKLVKILNDADIKYEVKSCTYPRITWEKTRIYILDSNLHKGTILKLIERKL